MYKILLISEESESWLGTFLAQKKTEDQGVSSDFWSQRADIPSSMQKNWTSQDEGMIHKEDIPSLRSSKNMVNQN